MEVFVVLFAAAVWDLLLGEPSSKVHPVVWMGKYIGAFWNRRPSGADDRKMLIFGGVLVVSGALLFSLPLRFLKLLPGLTALLLTIPLLKSVFSISAASVRPAKRAVVTGHSTRSLSGSGRQAWRGLCGQP